MLSSLLVALLGAIVPCSAVPQRLNARWTIGQPVKTTSGTVSGHEAAWPAKSGVSEYLGIPFAQAPTGSLRFAAPVRFKGSGSISGAKFAKQCPQIIDGVWEMTKGLNIPESLISFGHALGGDETAVFGEDCLNLNVWAKPQTGEKSKAVLVWIYGGAFGVGSTVVPCYNPARYAAEHDVVAVSINYRVNMLGFPMATFAPEKNPGLLDQRMAIEWVHDNIAYFGGDPKRITIFGESAGGASVDFYSYAYLKDPIVNGFISQSGTVTGLPANSQDDTPWWLVSNHTGCGSKTVGPEKSIACLRSLPVEKFMAGVKQVGAAGGAIGGASSLISFWPVSDGKTVFADAWDREKKGKFIKRPMLIGNNDAEGNIVIGAANEVLAWAVNQPGTTGTYSKQAKTALDWVSDSQSSGAAALRFFLKFIEEGVFSCPAATAAQARVRAGVPVWRYRFMGSWKNTNLGGLGAYHVSDVPLVMGTTERKKGTTKNEPEQEKLINNIMTAWATFAKDPDKGLEKLGWPRYDERKNTLIKLGEGNKGKVVFGLAIQYDEQCKAQQHVAPSMYKNAQTSLFKRATALTESQLRSASRE